MYVTGAMQRRAGKRAVDRQRRTLLGALGMAALGRLPPGLAAAADYRPDGNDAELSGQFGRDERSVAAELEVEHTGSTESTDQGVHEMATITRGYHIGAQGCQALGTRIRECHFHQRRSDCRTLTNYANDIVLGQFRISALVDGEIQRYWIYTRGERRSLVLSS